MIKYPQGIIHLCGNIAFHLFIAIILIYYWDKIVNKEIIFFAWIIILYLSLIKHFNVIYISDKYLIIRNYLKIWNIIKAFPLKTISMIFITYSMYDESITILFHDGNKKKYFYNFKRKHLENFKNKMLKHNIYVRCQNISGHEV
jgi:hypothetical protein